MAALFARLDPEVGALFTRMRGGFLDLGWRPGKQRGGEAWFFPLTGLPYVIVGADGADWGVNLLLHEIGHAFHDHLALAGERLIWHGEIPAEFAEFAAITMTHLARPYLARDLDGPYSPEEAARDRASYLAELVVDGLCELSLSDAFQHWVYAEAPEDMRPADLDANWVELATRFTPWWDWAGLGPYHAADWQREWGLFRLPFYDVTYELAHLGAL